MMKASTFLCVFQFVLLRYIFHPHLPFLSEHRMSLINETNDPDIALDNEVPSSVFAEDREREGADDTPLHLASRIHTIQLTQDAEAGQEEDDDDTNDEWEWDDDNVDNVEEVAQQEIGVVGDDDLSNSDSGSEIHKRRRVEGEQILRSPPSNTESGPITEQNASVSFPVARLKALFKVGYGCGSNGGSYGVALSADALSTLNHAVALLVEDLATTTLSKSRGGASNKSRKTITYSDLCETIVEDRYFFLKELIPQAQEKAGKPTQTIESFFDRR